MTNDDRTKLEPIEREGIRVYDCPLCDYTITGTLEEAREHVQTPLSRGVILPRGFVFGRDSDSANGFSVSIIASSKQFSVPELKNLGSNKTTHDYRYGAEIYFDSVKRRKNSPPQDYFMCIEDYSDFLSEAFFEGSCFLLDNDQFDEFRANRASSKKQGLGGESQFELVKDSELVRIIDEIEKWTGGRK